MKKVSGDLQGFGTGFDVFPFHPLDPIIIKLPSRILRSSLRCGAFLLDGGGKRKGYFIASPAAVVFLLSGKGKNYGY